MKKVLIWFLIFALPTIAYAAYTHYGSMIVTGDLQVDGTLDNAAVTANTAKEGVPASVDKDIYQSVGGVATAQSKIDGLVDDGVTTVNNLWSSSKVEAEITVNLAGGGDVAIFITDNCDAAVTVGEVEGDLCFEHP